MAAAGVVRWRSLWPLAFLVFSPLMCQALQPPMEVLVAPNLLRVGVAEKVFVEIQDCAPQTDMAVEVTVKNHPTKEQTLAQTSVNLRHAENCQSFGELTIPASHFSKDPNQKQYVVLQAHFLGRTLERIVLVSFQFGFIFIQTDKTIYTPDSSVLYRVFGVTPGMKPVEKSGPTSTDASVNIEIVNPDGITVETSSVSLRSGLYTSHYKLGKVVSHGQWKVVVRYHDNLQQSFTAPFEVKEYVLPTFEVKVKPTKPFFYVNEKELNFTINAKYLFGEEVEGEAMAVFGFVDESDKLSSKNSFPDSIQRLNIIRGTGTATLKREFIKAPYIISEMVGKQIYVSVSVLTHSGDEMVNTELRGIPIVTSPYTIHFRRTPSFFKPGFDFDVTVEVLNPDETPAPNIDVELTVRGGKTHRGRTENNGMSRLTINVEKSMNTLNIEARTDVPNVDREEQATADMAVRPYTATNNHYIHIGFDKPEVLRHENQKVLFQYNTQAEVKQLTYLILSRGQLIDHGSLKTTGQTQVAKILHIKEEMMPSFRIVAYYHTSDNKVASDSLWVDVKDSCMGSLKLEDSDSDTHHGSMTPQQALKLKVTGDPGASVGLVAVDKGVYVLNNKHRLTQKKIWDVIEKFDTGCTPGGGENSMGVFYDAGLLFVSSGSMTPYRQELKCPPATTRKKRSASILEVRFGLLSLFEKGKLRQCCMDGMTDTPVSYTCERRSEYIKEGQDCVDAFLHCCREIKKQIERKDSELTLARSSEINTDDLDAITVVTRTYFPESWLWVNVNLPPCSPPNSKCDPTSTTKLVPLPDTITTWQFTGISMSRTYGICVDDSFEVPVKMSFFIDLKVPYSAVRGEQLQIKAVIHNYSPTDVNVRVELKEEENMCSMAYKRGKFREDFLIGRQSTRAVFFIMIPMKDGKIPIVVKAIGKNSYGVYLTDEVSKTLRVVSDGVLTKEEKTIKLHPAAGGRQEISVNSEIPSEDMVPNTYTTTHISVTGREQLSNLLESAVGGKSMEYMIRAPYGCGEQNAAAMTFPLIAATYLDKTNQWEAAGLGKRDDALKYISQGYQSELAYRQDDNSFAVFQGSKGSSWLTAYVIKVFSMANNLGVIIDRGVICNAVRFLVLKAQQPDGVFVEIGEVYSETMRGGVLSTDSDVSMTAFCVIAMQESRQICQNQIDVSGSINKAVNYIEGRLPRVSYPYAVAIASYALANENKMNLQTLMNFATNGNHWPAPGSNHFTLEGTAYALLALVKAGELEKAKPVVRWFSQQQRYYGSYGSTQSTVMVYQAMAEYWANAEEPEYNLNIDVTLPGKSRPDRWKFNKKSQFSTRSSNFNNINQNVTIVAEGVGEATVKLVSMYYALPKVKESNCQRFNLSVQTTPVTVGEHEGQYKLTMKVLFKNPKHPSTMAILDVGLPTGFDASTIDLQTLSSGYARLINKFEKNNQFTEKSNVIIYLNTVSYTNEDEITFHIHQKMKVGNIQPAAVSVYEYNNREEECVRFYNPLRRSGALMRLCENDDVCTCAEENCSMQKYKKIDNNKRTQKICESTQTSKIEFAYKIRVENVLEGSSMDIYNARIVDVIKEARDIDANPIGQLRTFRGRHMCQESLALTVGKTYLVMGSSTDITGPRHNPDKFKYALGENTWVEYWPTDAECQAQGDLATICAGINDMVEVFRDFGCLAK